MCGRARCTVNPQQIASACGISQTTSTLQFDRYRPSYNVLPGAYLPVVRRGGEGAPTEVIHCMKWGLVPSFTKKSEKPDHFRMAHTSNWKFNLYGGIIRSVSLMQFNARSESVKESASFRRLIPNNRCLVVIEGFYEWKKDGSKKQPYYIHFKDDQPLVLAALYDSWENSEGDTLYTFTILTTGCSSALQWLHDRMPVILGDKDSIALWLGNSQGKLESILRPYEDPDLVWYPVTPAIGKTTFDVPECVKEINLKPVAKNPISKFFAKKIDNKCQLEPGSQKTSKSSLLADVEEESDALESKEVTNKKCKDSDAFPSLKNELTDAVAPGIKREFEEVETDAFQQRNEPIDADAPVVNRQFAEVTTDSGPTPERNSSLPKSPVKKKGRISGGKQATLLSYFGKG